MVLVGIFTLPSSIVYVPSPGITTGSSVGSPVSGLISLGAFASSISTVFGTPLTVTVPPLILVILFVVYLEYL